MRSRPPRSRQELASAFEEIWTVLEPPLAKRQEYCGIRYSMVNLKIRILQGMKQCPGFSKASHFQRCEDAVRTLIGVCSEIQQASDMKFNTESY